ncbi:hypothetical protein SAMN06264855_13118 [Halorubrum vacuolatum]|uniref:Uncharacterized protein n=1 Tax=Halorubrum vacuolatum TaxID=63740 RepID=A0A238Y5M4_HALVU|nr:hypothetical protein SAMN06264855_13118 [Halorubrum vacuolatum]
MERAVFEFFERVGIGIDRRNVVAGELAGRALETRRPTGDQQLLFIPVAGIKQDVPPRGRCSDKD